MNKRIKICLPYYNLILAIKYEMILDSKIIDVVVYCLIFISSDNSIMVVFVLAQYRPVP